MEGEKVLHGLVSSPFTDVKNQILSRQAAAMVANEIRKVHDPDSYERGVTLLLSELRKATHQARLRELLEGLGNAGHPKTLEVIAPYLKHDSRIVRVAAFQSMRLNKSKAATDLFMSSLLHDGQDFYVRSRILSLVATLSMSPRYIDTFREYLQREGKPMLIMEGLTAIAHHGPRGLRVVQDFVNHRSDKVKAKAQALLKGVTP